MNPRSRDVTGVTGPVTSGRIQRMAPVKSWPPRHCSLRATTRTRSRGWEAIDFINHYARITKESVGGHAGDLIELRPWQERLILALLAEDESGKLRHRAALVGMARKNGKSALGAGLALWSLYTGKPGGEVYSCAGTRDQARIVFDTAKTMVELDPELSGVTRLYRDAIEYTKYGSVYRVLSSEAGASEGLSPTFVVFDEVHVQPDDELWNVMQLGAGAREEPLLLGITTAGARTDRHGQDSFCYSLYQHGRKVVTGEVDDPSFFFAWWEPKRGVEADHRDPRVWAEANPGLGDICAVPDFHSTLPRTPESEFRTKRTNVWTTAESSALPFGVWEKCADPKREVANDVDVVLMFDGSWSHDSTAIVAATVEEVPHLWVIEAWERPADAVEWHTEVAVVEETIREAARQYRVVRIFADEWLWRPSLQLLESEGLPMEKFPQSPQRMSTAWGAFKSAVLDRKLTHSGDPRMSRHVANMVVKTDFRGERPTKVSKSSERHIDLGICAVGAYSEAQARLHNLEPVLAQPRVIFL